MSSFFRRQKDKGSSSVTPPGSPLAGSLPSSPSLAHTGSPQPPAQSTSSPSLSSSPTSAMLPPPALVAPPPLPGKLPPPEPAIRLPPPEPAIRLPPPPVAELPGKLPPPVTELPPPPPRISPREAPAALSIGGPPELVRRRTGTGLAQLPAPQSAAAAAGLDLIGPTSFGVAESAGSKRRSRMVDAKELASLDLMTMAPTSSNKQPAAVDGSATARALPAPGRSAFFKEPPPPPRASAQLPPVTPRDSDKSAAKSASQKSMLSKTMSSANFRKGSVLGKGSSVSTSSSSSAASSAASSSGFAATKGVGSSVQAIGDLDRQKAIIQAIFQQDTPHRDVMNVFLELYTSEVSYVISLHKIVLYAIPEAKKALAKKSSAVGGVDRLFGNIEEIRDVHVAFLDALVDRYKKWSDTCCVSDILLSSFAAMRAIYSHYCAHYESASQLLPTFAKKKSLVKLTELVQQTCEQPLPALLIMPVQRLPRYRMLLEDLLRRMERGALGTEHPDYAPMQQALQLIGAIADEINAALREAANQRTVAHVMKTVKGSELFTSSPNRRIVADAERIKITVLSAEGALKLGNQQTQATYDRAILLTDVIVFCSASTSKADTRHDIMEQVDIHLCWVDDAVPAGYDAATSLRFLTPEQEYVVTCGSRLERESWRSTVTNGIQSWVDAHKMNGTPTDSGEFRRKFEYLFSDASALLPGATYRGEWLLAKPNGQGCIVNSAAGGGDVYDGQVSNGRRTGHGVATWPSGSSYDGQWQKDLPHGQGRLTVLSAADKSTVLYEYTGAWYLGRRHGEGQARWLGDGGVETTAYAGTMKNDRFDGVGTLTVAGHSRYEGEFVGGVYHGKGKLQLANGDVYTATWTDGVLCGAGELSNARTGLHYVGDWLHNRYHGDGALSNSTLGWRYVGSFRDGQCHGHGVATYADGASYDGAWENGYWHGRGVYTRAAPHRLSYDGAFVRGCWDGQGTLTTDHYTYTGGFEANRPHGAGELTADHCTYTGGFRSGLRHGDGVCRVLDDAKNQLACYTGSFVADLFHGRGRLVTAQGTFDGDWLHGQPAGQGKLIQPLTTYNGAWARGLMEGAGNIVTADGAVVTGTWQADRLQGTVDVANIAAPGVTTRQSFKDGVLQTQYLSAMVPVFHPDQTIRGQPFNPAIFSSFFFL